MQHIRLYTYMIFATVLGIFGCADDTESNKSNYTFPPVKIEPYNFNYKGHLFSIIKADDGYMSYNGFKSQRIGIFAPIKKPIKTFVYGIQGKVIVVDELNWSCAQRVKFETEDKKIGFLYFDKNKLNAIKIEGKEIEAQGVTQGWAYQNTIFIFNSSHMYLCLRWNTYIEYKGHSTQIKLIEDNENNLYNFRLDEPLFKPKFQLHKGPKIYLKKAKELIWLLHNDIGAYVINQSGAILNLRIECEIEKKPNFLIIDDEQVIPIQKHRFQLKKHFVLGDIVVTHNNGVCTAITNKTRQVEKIHITYMYEQKQWVAKIVEPKSLKVQSPHSKEPILKAETLKK